MRILALTSKYSGVGYHRIMMPLVNMRKDYCLITDVINDEILEHKFDLVIMNRMLSHPVSEIEAWRDKYGFKLIVDNDDHWQLDPSHILNQSYKDNDVTNRILSYIEIADLCTCTHERLATEIYEINKSVEIIPNAIPYGEEQFQDNKIESELVRFFWSGSGTHERDIEILRFPMKRINFPIKTVIAGYNDGEKPVWDKMIVAFTNGLKLNPMIYNYNEVTKYMAAYADSDVSLIPLLDTSFNRMKSNLKILETAAKHNPAIVSNVHPYKDMPVCYVNSQKDWYYWIKLLTNDKQARQEMGEELFRYCNTHFNLHDVNKQRFAIYNKLIDNANI